VAEKANQAKTGKQEEASASADPAHLFFHRQGLAWVFNGNGRKRQGKPSRNRQNRSPDRGKRLDKPS
jgi:hypothetical protein